MQFCQKFIIALALMFSAAASAQPTAPIDAAKRKETIEGAIRQLNAHYVFPEMAKKVEAMLVANMNAKAYDGFDDAAKFASRLTENVQAVTGDKHIRVRYTTVNLPEGGGDKPSAEQIAQMKKQSETDNYGIEKVERLPLNIGYIDLRGFMPVEFASESISAAMTLIANTDALIVDLRKNGGGSPAMVSFMTSYLFEERTHLNSLYRREGNRTDQFWTQEWVPGKRFGQKKPVYVLTSNRTFSGAEEFSYNLKQLKRATLIGETTGGGANPGGFRRIAANFGMFIPTGRAINPITNTNWEGTGVEPDVKVSVDDALRTAQILALKKIGESEKDAEYGKRLQQRIDE
ncbi:MAG: S41 family peptidase, partial [Usitatibacteraceae bacterium]